jgi:hypothetical protein
MSNKAYLSITKKGDLLTICAVCNAIKEIMPGVPSQLLCARINAWMGVYRPAWVSGPSGGVREY